MNRGEIRSLVRGYLNEPFASFWTDAELNTYINIAIRKATDTIKNLSRHHFTTRATFSTTAGQEYYQLPATCKDVKLITVINSDGIEVPVYFATWPDPFKTTDSALGPGSTAGDLVNTVWIVGGSLRMVPIPQSVFTMRIYFEARINNMTADADIPTFDEDYHDMAGKWAAIEARAKNKESSADLLALWQVREQDCIRDLFHRVPAPATQVIGYLQDIAGS